MSSSGLRHENIRNALFQIVKSARKITQVGEGNSPTLPPQISACLEALVPAEM